MEAARGVWRLQLKFSQPGKVDPVWSKPVIQQLFKNAVGNVEDFQGPEAGQSKSCPQEVNNKARGHCVRVDHSIRVDQSDCQAFFGGPRSGDISGIVIGAHLQWMVLSCYFLSLMVFWIMKPACLWAMSYIQSRVNPLPSQDRKDFCLVIEFSRKPSSKQI